MLLEDQFNYIFDLIKNARNKALQAVNKEQIILYWTIGQFVERKLETAEWGEGAVKKLSAFLQSKDPTLSNFSVRGIYRMRQFHIAYPDVEIVTTLSSQLSWSHNLEILTATKSIEERLFYSNLTIKERLNVQELRRHLKTSYYERSMIANQLLPPSLDNYPRDVSNIFKDSYVFEFAQLLEKYSEKDLKRALLSRLKYFIMELGKDFVFMGEEYRLPVGMKDYRVDLLFYHRELCCMVAFDLKIEDFEPSFIGQMNFYLEVLDTDIKKAHENPSIGVLICKNKDIQVVEYALRRNLSPTLVADYTTKLLDKDLLMAKVQELFRAIKMD
jgi:predicted nuclease of restriction endonuclease-like (RecB) superfamily